MAASLCWHDAGSHWHLPRIGKGSFGLKQVACSLALRALGISLLGQPDCLPEEQPAGISACEHPLKILIRRVRMHSDLYQRAVADAPEHRPPHRMICAVM